VSARLLAIAVLALVACRPEVPTTEVIVTIDTPFGVPCTIDTLQIEAVSGDDVTTEEIVLAETDLPGSFTIVRGDGEADMTVSVTGLRGGEPFAVAQQDVSFLDDTSLELRFVLDRSCVPGPCPAVGVGGYDGLTEPVPRRGCGTERYESVLATFAMRDACGMDPAIVTRMFASTTGVDEGEETLPGGFPFPFRFYGQAVDTLWVGTNGYLGLGQNRPRGLAADSVVESLGGAVTLEGPAIAAFWDNLSTGPQGICIATTGRSPDRLLWVTWKESCFSVANMPCGPSVQGRLTFTVALEETTDRIFIGFQEMVAATAGADRAKGQTAVIGITSTAAKGCAANACSVEGLCPDGAACGYTEISAKTIRSPLPDVELQPR